MSAVTFGKAAQNLDCQLDEVKTLVRQMDEHGGTGLDGWCNTHQHRFEGHVRAMVIEAFRDHSIQLLRLTRAKLQARFELKTLKANGPQYSKKPAVSAQTTDPASFLNQVMAIWKLHEQVADSYALEKRCLMALSWLRMYTSEAPEALEPQLPASVHCHCVQIMKQDDARNLDWAIFGSAGTKEVFVTFEENTFGVSMVHSEFCHEAGRCTEWGSLHAYQGMWTSVFYESKHLGRELKKVLDEIGDAEIVFCGSSKGGAEAVAAATCLLVPGLALGGLCEVPPGCSVNIMTFGAPAIIGKKSGALGKLTEELKKCNHAKNVVDPRDPFPAGASQAISEIEQLPKAGAAAQWALPEDVSELADLYCHVVDLHTLPVSSNEPSSMKYDPSAHGLNHYIAQVFKCDFSNQSDQLN